MTPIEFADELKRRWVLSKFRLNMILYALLNNGCANKFDYLEPKEDYGAVKVTIETKYPKAVRRIFDSELDIMIKEGLISSSAFFERWIEDGLFSTEVHLDLMLTKEVREAAS